MSDDAQNGWNEYSRLVLKELESLAENISALNKEIQELKQEIAQMRAKEDRVEELKSWKEKIDEVASPSQLKELMDEVQSLKIFKTKAITVFAVIQFGMAATIWLLKIVA
jgi:uncharacterized coiled-coil DUF342 family protein